jgi:hypothetical protein
VIFSIAAFLIGAIGAWRLCSWERDRGMADLLAGLYLRGYLKREAFEAAQNPAEMRAILEVGHQHGH